VEETFIAQEDQQPERSAAGPMRACMPYFAAAFMMSVANGLTPPAQQMYAEQALGAGLRDLGSLAAVGALTFLLFCPLMGHISLRVNRRWMLAGAALVSSLCAAGIAHSSQIWHLFALCGTGGIAAAAFWPPLEVELSHSAGTSELRRILGAFNLSWCGGVWLGMSLSGAIYEWSRLGPFIVASVMSGSVAVFLLCVKPRQASASRHETEAAITTPSRADATLFVWIGWLANLAVFMVPATLRAFFPHLGLQLGFKPSLITPLLCMTYVGQSTAFLFLGAVGGWQYRFGLFLAMQTLTVTGLLAACFVSHWLGFLVAFYLMGLTQGFTYTSSINYSLTGDLKTRGFRTGVHEAMIGIGLFLGPALGGNAAAFAARLGRRSAAVASMLPDFGRLPFWTVLCVLILSMAGQSAIYFLWRARRRK